MKKSIFCILFLAAPLCAEMKDLPTLLYYPKNSGSNTPASSGVTIDANNERIVWINQFSETSTIRKIGFMTGTVTTGDALEVRLESVDPATGLTNGTLLCANSSTTVVTVNTDDAVWKTSNNLVADCVVGSTLPFGTVIQSTGSSFNGGINGKIEGTSQFSYYASSINGAGFVKANGYNNVGFEKTDGTYVKTTGNTAWSGFTTTGFNSATNPNTRGALFTLPARVRVKGFWTTISLSNLTTSRGNCSIYSSTPAAIMATYVASGTYSAAANSVNIYEADFPSSVFLEANNNYRFACQSMGTGNINLTTINSFSAATDAANVMGSNWILTTASNPTKESDWTNTPLFHPWMGLVIDQIDISQTNGGMSVGY